MIDLAIMNVKDATEELRAKKFLEWAAQCGYEVGENGQRN